MEKFHEAIAFLLITIVLCQTGNGLTHRLPYSNETNHCSTKFACPSWFICNSEKKCQCGNEHNYAVVCDDKKLVSAVLDCNCVTYDAKTASTYLGTCFYNCENANKKKVDRVYRKLPTQPEMLINKSSCKYFHRTGILCGDCEDGYSPLVLSYNLSCVKCPDGNKNWWKFILVAFVPLTFFYFFVVLFNINVTSSRLHGVVWFSQAISTPGFVRLIMTSLRHANKNSVIAAKVFLVPYSFWNLDMFRSIIPDICLNISTLQALALDYLLALYPFVLILFSYFIIELYDRNYSFMITAWKPFHKVLRVFRKSWDVRTSVIDSFSTFYLLSYMKINSVTTDLLAPTQIYELGSNITTFGLYYSPTVAYFGSEHRPYAICALVLFTLFVSIPTAILFLYPFDFFQRLLSMFPFNWYFLRAFVDSFQGCYKDGTESGTFDCRWFSTLLLLFRPLLFLAYGLTLSMIFFVYATMIVVVLLIAIINIQPYKKKATRYPSTDVNIFLLLSFCYVVFLGRGVATTESNIFIKGILTISYTAAFVPVVYFLSLVCFWLVSRTMWIRKLFERLL